MLREIRYINGKHMYGAGIGNYFYPEATCLFWTVGQKIAYEKFCASKIVK
jgi:hypothetical protein